jgi:hypothetical protein
MSKEDYRYNFLAELTWLGPGPGSAEGLYRVTGGGGDRA